MNDAFLRETISGALSKLVSFDGDLYGVRPPNALVAVSISLLERCFGEVNTRCVQNASPKKLWYTKYDHAKFAKI